MEKDKIFFASEGLTTTSANHIANLAKEAYKSAESELNNIVFYTTEIGLLGSYETNTLKEGVTENYLDSIEPTLMKIAQLKSLIAWLREAIKAKDRLIREASGLSDTTIAEALGITLPEMPHSYMRLSTDEVVASWNIKQRNRYYYLDTVCAVIGSYIHPDGGYANAKENLIKILSEKHVTSGNGRDLVIYTRTPTVDIAKVDSTFFALQEEYRGYQAELNSMKHQIELVLQEDDREKSQKEEEESKTYQAASLVASAQISAYRKDMVRSMQSLKIVIPDSLKGIYEFISKMGK